MRNKIFQTMPILAAILAGCDPRVETENGDKNTKQHKEPARVGSSGEIETRQFAPRCPKRYVDRLYDGQLPKEFAEKPDRSKERLREQKAETYARMKERDNEDSQTLDRNGSASYSWKIPPDIA